MAKRRGKGEGSIRERADGRWEVRIDLGRGLDGKRRQKSVFAGTESGAITALKKLHARTVGGHVLATSTPTVKQYLEDWYSATKTAGGRAPGVATAPRLTATSRPPSACFASSI